MNIDRRSAILGLGASWLMLGSSAAYPNWLSDQTPLAARAKRKGMTFGYALDDPDIALGSQGSLVVTLDADIIVPNMAMKWNRTVTADGKPDYSLATRYVAFAKQHGLAIRGHTAFWYRSMPTAAEAAMKESSWHDVMIDRVTSVVGNFKGLVKEWDVVNEAIEPNDKQPNLMRLAPFGRPMDAGYVVDCFNAARAADPQAVLYYNDFGLETDDPYAASRRSGVLRLLNELKKRNAPIDALGIQGHLNYGWRFTDTVFRSFLQEVAAMGLKIRITELDVADTQAPGGTAKRDSEVADYARKFLDTALDEKAVTGLLCWGMRDGQSWMQSEGWTQRPDGQPLRPLPYDNDFHRKRLWYAIGAALDGAPAR